MGTILTDSEIISLREGGKKLVEVFEILKSHIRPGVNLLELSDIAEKEILARDAIPCFKGYEGFPAAACLSADEQVVHCIPVDRVLKEGEIITVDMGLSYQGINTDAAVTWGVGEISADRKRLLEGTYRALLAGTDQVRPGIHVNTISAAIEGVLKASNLTIFKQFVGHGIGHELHEDPYIPNFASGEVGPTLSVNQAIAIEPITGLGVDQIITASDGWSVATADGRPSAHFEHTILVSESGFEVITPLETLLGSN